LINHEITYDAVMQVHPCPFGPPFKRQGGSPPSCTLVPASLIGSSGGLIITAHTSSYLFCSPNSCSLHITAT